MKVYLELDGEKVLSCNSSPISPECIEVEVESNHPILFGTTGYKYIDGILFLNEEELRIELLQNAKKSKNKELNDACQNAILEGFSHHINGERYWFKYDIESQINFERLSKMFDRDSTREHMLTVENSDNEHIGIAITKKNMTELSIVSQKHVDKKVAKFRDYYMPLVNEAETVEEVEEIQWVTDEEVISDEELQSELDRLNSNPTIEELQEENRNLTTAILELSDLVLGGIE